MKHEGAQLHRRMRESREIRMKRKERARGRRGRGKERRGARKRGRVKGKASGENGRCRDRQ